MTSEYKLSKYKIIKTLKSENGKTRPNHTYRIIQVEGKEYKRGKIWYIVEVNKNKGYGWIELRRSIHLEIIEKNYNRWVN